MIDLGDDQGMHIAVKAADTSSAAARPVAVYAQGKIFAGNLVIQHPTPAQRFFLNGRSGTSLFTLMLIAAASIIVIVMTPKFNDQNLFRKDASGLIRILGYLVIFHGIALTFLNTYEYRIVQEATQQTFNPLSRFPILLWGEMYAGFVIVAIATWYRRGVQLQQEQDLTV